MKCLIKTTLLLTVIQGCSNFKGNKNYTNRSKGSTGVSGTSSKRIRISTNNKSQGKNLQKKSGIHQLSDDVRGKIIGFLTLQEVNKMYHLNHKLINQKTKNIYLKHMFLSKNFPEFLMLKNKNLPVKLPLHIFLNEESLNNRKSLGEEKRNSDLLSMTKKVNNLFKGRYPFLFNYCCLLQNDLGIVLLDVNSKNESNFFTLPLTCLQNRTSHKEFLQWALSSPLKQDQKTNTNLGRYGKVLLSCLNRNICNHRDIMKTGYVQDQLSEGESKCSLTFRSPQEELGYDGKHKLEFGRDSHEDVSNQPIQFLLSVLRMKLDEKQLLNHLKKVPGIDKEFYKVGFPELIFWNLCYGCVGDSDYIIPDDLEKILVVLKKFYRVNNLGKIDAGTWGRFVQNMANQLLLSDTGCTYLTHEDKDEVLQREISRMVKQDDLIMGFVNAMKKHFFIDTKALYNNDNFNDFEYEVGELEEDGNVVDSESFPLPRFVDILSDVLKGLVSA